jgi:glycerol-3-phosphate dehydrogenase
MICSRAEATYICISSLLFRRRSSQSLGTLSSALVPLVLHFVNLLIASTDHYESYTGNDPIGIELAGALKNVYAIAAGMSDGLGWENNTRAS